MCIPVLSEPRLAFDVCSMVVFSRAISTTLPLCHVYNKTRKFAAELVVQVSERWNRDTWVRPKLITFDVEGRMQSFVYLSQHRYMQVGQQQIQCSLQLASLPRTFRSHLLMWPVEIAKAHFSSSSDGDERHLWNSPILVSKDCEYTLTVIAWCIYIIKHVAYLLLLRVVNVCPTSPRIFEQLV